MTKALSIRAVIFRLWGRSHLFLEATIEHVAAEAMKSVYGFQFSSSCLMCFLITARPARFRQYSLCLSRETPCTCLAVSDAALASYFHALLHMLTLIEGRATESQAGEAASSLLVSVHGHQGYCGSLEFDGKLVRWRLDLPC